MKIFCWMLIIIIVIAVVIFTYWSEIINQMLPSDSRPYEIVFATETIDIEHFERIASELELSYGVEFKHIENFREAGILTYEGPKTCLNCHQEITFKKTNSGEEITTDLMDNLLTSAHYRFYTSNHPDVYGFNGELVGNFPMGKINRPCPKPGSFAMTAWASLVILDNGDTLSEGCGQCHIGGQYQAPLGEIMPGYRTLDIEKEVIDCLICHAVAYDMNQKQVVIDDNGLARWNQDRSIKAAMSVTKPTAQSCLRCHQHNMAGDIYVDSLDESFHESIVNQGVNRPRISHPGSKRGTPFSPSWDVHAAAGMDCIECHTTEGHYIAKGTHTTTIMANDLPGVEVSCEKCHSTEPHSENEEMADFLNNHIEIIACQTCHIPSLNSDNATYRDFSKPIFEEHQGIYVYEDSLKLTKPGEGIKYMWWNGDATFLGNPVGDNPNGRNLYKFYKPSHIWPEFAEFDYDSWYEETMRPIAQNGRKSRIYAMKLFNGKQHIDLQNIGPFGGMYLPYNLPTYYRTGDPDLAAAKEMDHSMMKMMYGPMFKYYLMDKFMSFMNVKSWNTAAYENASRMKEVEARWIPNDAYLEISHAIRRDGALSCIRCHSPDGVMDFAELGYDENEVAELIEIRDY